MNHFGPKAAMSQAHWRRAAVVLSMLLWTASASAYPSYDDGAGNGCVECHTGFQGGTGALHQQHRFDFGITTCNLCHPNGGGTTPVRTYWSGPGGGFGCAGCHGQDYGETSPNSLMPKATAYGLRQWHVAQQGITACGTGSCHQPGSQGHGSPFPPLFPETELPPYFGQPTNNLTDPCSSAQEDLSIDADSVGLDNDGDGAADYPADSDCPEPPTPTPTTSPTPTAVFECAATPVSGCISGGKGVVSVNEKTAGKEKMKVVMKSLQSTVVPGQFGNPVAGTTAYKVCIYGDANQLAGEYTVAQAGAMCSGSPCWSAVSSKGFKYKDKGMTTDGILKINLLGGDAGKGKIVFIGKNKTSSLPTGVAPALLNQTSATAQIISSDASCFAMSFSQVKKADGDIFKAVGP